MLLRSTISFARWAYDNFYFLAAKLNFALFIVSFIPSIVIMDIHPATIGGLTTVALLGLTLFIMPNPKAYEDKDPFFQLPEAPHKRLFSSSTDTQHNSGCCCDHCNHEA